MSSHILNPTAPISPLTTSQRRVPEAATGTHIARPMINAAISTLNASRVASRSSPRRSRAYASHSHRYPEWALR